MPVALSFAPTLTKKNIKTKFIIIRHASQSGIENDLTPLPKGISPFEKSFSKSLDIQGSFRSLAKKGVDTAIADGMHKLLEIEFPPLLGGYESKSQFDDFDNVQELDRNKDWTVQFAPMFLEDSKIKNRQKFGGGKTWLIFPDLKECELARKEWAGARYTEATFTTLQAATEFSTSIGSTDLGEYDAPWGAAIANSVNSLFNKNQDKRNDGKNSDGGFLGNESALDQLTQGENAPSELQLVVQPGNGGPVEDWINCEKIFDSSPPNLAMVIVNGALDKVRNNYYPAVFFPKLASTVDRFYSRFESVFYLKPISDKGVYGWLYRVYPEVSLALKET